jgi:hypothetical protein
MIVTRSRLLRCRSHLGCFCPVREVAYGGKIHRKGDNMEQVVGSVGFELRRHKIVI